MRKLFKRGGSIARQQPDRSTEAGFAISPDVRASLHQDAVVFLHVGRGLIFTSNRIGARIWGGLLDHGHLDGIAAEISGEYGVPQEQVERDAAGFVAELEAEGLLTRVTGL